MKFLPVHNQHSLPSPIQTTGFLPDLDLIVASLVVLLKVDVDGEMRIDITHLVLETLGNTDDEVVDVGADGTESGNVLARTVMNLDSNDVLLGLREVDCQVIEVLDKLSCSRPCQIFAADLLPLFASDAAYLVDPRP